MYLYENQFLKGHDFPFVERPTKVLVIASTGRCGSHMLGHTLYETGSFGFPLEYVSPTNLPRWKARFDCTDFIQVLKHIQQHRTSANGVFGIKIHYRHIAQFGGFHKLQSCLPQAYFVHLSRKDVLRQAVSLALARQTGVWIAGQKPANTDAQYSYNQIEGCLRETILDNASWRYTLAAHDCRHIEMEFDAVTRNIAGAIREIADFMGLSLNDARIPEQPMTRKQRMSIGEQWAELFLSEFKESELVAPESSTVSGDIKGGIRRLVTMPLRLRKHGR